jgi:hypothetical protein
MLFYTVCTATRSTGQYPAIWWGRGMMAVSSAECHGVALGIVCRVGYQGVARKVSQLADGQTCEVCMFYTYAGCRRLDRSPTGNSSCPYSRGGADCSLDALWTSLAGAAIASMVHTLSRVLGQT